MVYIEAAATRSCSNSLRLKEPRLQEESLQPSRATLPWWRATSAGHAALTTSPRQAACWKPKVLGWP